MKKHIMLRINNNLNINLLFSNLLTLLAKITLILTISTSQNCNADQNKSDISNKQSNQLINQYKNDLVIIENFLNNIKNLTANFTQTTNKSIVNGKFYLSRIKDQSGKMRIEYSTDPKVLIVVNGAILTYKDIELDEVSKLSTNSTPASFLTRPNISFTSKDIEITNIIKENDQIKISLLKKNRKDAGEFSIIFNTNPLEFIKMEVKNDLSQVISVKLSDIEFPENITNNLYIIKNNEF